MIKFYSLLAHWIFEFFELYCFRKKWTASLPRSRFFLYVCGKLSQLDPRDPFVFGPNVFRPGLYGKHEDNPGKIYKSARRDMKFMYYSVYYINKHALM